jgi:hypothetical protein
MGRTIDFENIEGEDSFFYIDVPILDTKLVSEGEQAVSHSISASVRTSNKKMILLPRLTFIAIQY